MAYSKVSEMSQNLANSPGYNNFLMMPLIGMLLSRRKKETADESTTTEEKNYKNVPKNKDPNFTKCFRDSKN